MKRPFLAAIVMLSVAPGCGPKPTGQSAVQPIAETTSKPAARSVKLEVKDYEGIMDLIASHQGKVVVMDAWSTWCEPCMKEFPGLVALDRKYGPDRVACISLSFNYDGGKNEKPLDHEQEVLDFLRQRQATFQNLISSDPADDLYKKFGFGSIPAVFVYDQRGKLVKMFDNSEAKGKLFTYRDVEALVERLLKDNA